MLDFFRDSRFFGRPIELFKFAYGPREQDTYCYTDSETPITYGGNQYLPVTIKRGQISNSGNLDKSAMDVSTRHDLPVAQLFRVYPPAYVVTLTVYQGEASDAPVEFRPIWVGRVLASAFDGIQATLTCEPISSSFRRAGLRRNYQYMCPHALYGPQCKASKAAASTTVNVTSVSGKLVVLGGELTNPSRYTGGMLEWVKSDGLVEVRTITAAALSSGHTVLTLTSLAPGLTPGTEATAILGCKHTLVSCSTDHANAPNYGGMPWIPMKNPIGNVSPF